jgi:hypothetical protein
MTPPTVPNKGFKIGFRYVSFFELNAHQTPKATSATVGYEGLHYESARALTINNAQPRIISQPGDDTVEALQALQPSTAMDADLHVGMSNLDILAVLGDVKVDSLGISTRWLPMQTDKRGYEPYVGILAYSKSNEWPSGEHSWDWYFLPYAQAIWLASGNAETPQDEIFKVVPNYTTLTPWGVALTAAANGALTQQAIKGKSTGIPHLISWLADGSATDFSFDTAHPAYDADAIAVFVNETLDATAAATVTKVTPTVAPSANDRIVVFYEE